jgi:taurine transport system permease protein
VFEWLSDNRASIAAVIIIALVVMFVASIFIGRKQARMTAKDAVFGDPERTRGGWYWAVCGVAALMLVWFYFSAGAWAVPSSPTPPTSSARLPRSKKCLSPIKAQLPIGSRYYKSTLLVGRNADQLDEVVAGFPGGAFSDAETAELNSIVADIRKLIANSSDPANVNPELKSELDRIASEINGLSDVLRNGPAGMSPTPEALAQPKWGVTRIEIPILPMTPRGVMFDDVASKAAEVTTAFNKARNIIPANDRIIADLKVRIDALKAVNEAGSFAPTLPASAKITSRPWSASTGGSMTERSSRPTRCKRSMTR